jgi:(p)ppGpp synthase/HD superfamily hydrolase
LLNDTIEDTNTTEVEISDTFNPVVANLVKGMTNEKTTKDIFGPLKKAAEKDNRIILVKLADRLDNLTDGIYDMPRTTQKKYLEKTPKILELSCSYGIVKFHEDINERLERLEEYYNRIT